MKITPCTCRKSKLFVELRISAIGPGKEYRIYCYECYRVGPGWESSKEAATKNWNKLIHAEIHKVFDNNGDDHRNNGLSYI